MFSRVLDALPRHVATRILLYGALATLWSLTSVLLLIPTDRLGALVASLLLIQLTVGLAFAWHLGTALRERDQRLEEQARAQRELIANVSHELRTPLARVRVLLDLMVGGDDPDTARRRLSDISEDLAELERLVDDVLTAARFDAVEREPMPMHTLEAITVNHLMTTCAERVRARYGDSHRLQVEAPEPSATLLADVGLLRRALGNLVDNAYKYSAAGSQIRVAALPPVGDRVTVVIEDHGVGIGADDVQNLFRPFFRGDRSRTRNTGGVGLGLVLAKRIVEAHGGKVSLESSVGAGTTVRVELPILALPRSSSTGH